MRSFLFSIIISIVISLLLSLVITAITGRQNFWPFCFVMFPFGAMLLGGARKG